MSFIAETYAIQVARSAMGRLATLEPDSTRLIDEQIRLLERNPRPEISQVCHSEDSAEQCILLLDSGGHRLIYSVDDSTKTVSILSVSKIPETIKSTE